MALSPKDRERIIEEETLRYETRMNLHKQACAHRPVRWPWVILGAILVYLAWCWIFCGGSMGYGRCNYHSMGMAGHHCNGMNWAPDDNDGDAKPAQPVEPQKK